MFLRTLSLAGGLVGAAGLSQYPEFSQQYTQNLAGQVAALETVVADFDASADRSGLSRQMALAQMTGTQFLDDRRADMTRTIGRYESLSAHHAALSGASPLQRLLMPHRMGDGETFTGTWDHFAPALPLSAAGAVSGAAGFVGGWAAIALILSLLGWPFRLARRAARREERPRADMRPEPPLTRA